MSQVLDFKDVAARPDRVRLRTVPPRDDGNPFWPEVSPQQGSCEAPAVDPANAPGRVLSEVAALFSAVALLIFAVTVFVPGP